TCLNQVTESRLNPISNSNMLIIGNSIFLSEININCNVPGSPITLYTDATETVTLEDNGMNGDAVANDGIFSLLWTPAKIQTYGLDYGNGDIVSVIVKPVPPPPTYHPNIVTYQYETITGTALHASLGGVKVAS